jgi:hypothetical protein
MPRFVVLQHDLPARLHWDFMLELGPALATWALPLPPNYGHTLNAARLADHRLEYLTYEGPVSGDRGSVVRWDEGRFHLVEQTETGLVVDLTGRKLTGRLQIERIDNHTDRWHLARSR